MEVTENSEAASLLDAVTRYARDFLSGEQQINPVDRATVRDLLSAGNAPVAGHHAAETVQRLIRAGDAGMLTAGGKRGFGYVVGGALPVGIAADWLTSVWDQCAAVHDLSPVAAEAEEICQEWLRDWLGLPTHTVMGLTSGCTTANLMCLAAARECQLERAGWTATEQGMRDAPPLTVLVGQETHISVLRCLRLLGLGGQIQYVRADDDGRMNVRHLRELVDRAPRVGLIVCGEVGATNTGAVDPLAEIAEVTHQRGGWLHLDGAFGLWAVVSPRLRPQLNGLAQADSWATDGHKWLNTPYDCGLAFCAHPAPFHQAVAVHADYLHTTAPTGRDPLDYRVEMSQRARALTLWSVLHHLGREGLAELVERNTDAARRVAGRLAAEPGVSLLVPVRLNQILAHIGDEQHTMRVVDRLRAEGRCWITPTRWRGSAAIRLSVCSWRIDSDAAIAAADAIVAAHRAERAASGHAFS